MILKNLVKIHSIIWLTAIILIGCETNKQPEVNEKEPQGEFTLRHEMTRQRLTGDRYKPVFTDEFILADVNIDLENPRRFYNYSGDLSGRYIEALSPCCNEEECQRLDNFVQEALKYQKPDGRFGSSELIFTREYIDKEHTALLWGNGRLLVGLLGYYKKNPDKKVLDVAIRIGDFFLDTYSELTPEVIKRLEGLGAAGTICFTQWAEPLVMLSQATGNARYAEIAAKVYPSLPPRGKQHSHGYLTTLRGVLDLYEYTKDKVHLDFVMNSYHDLIQSEDFTIYGSVKEYFGGKGGRDEGCSHVDFMRLSLHLYKITGTTSYLERAEFATFNALYFNQFFTGDFGHHPIDHIEAYSKIVNAAWWCCTMSGLRAMQIIKDNYFVENKDGTIKLNLYIDTEYVDDRLSLKLTREKNKEGYHSYNILFEKAEDLKQPMMLRYPTWAEDFSVTVNGKEVATKVENGYCLVYSKPSAGDMFQVNMKYKTRILFPDKSTKLLEEINSPVSGALCYGPFIMAVDNKLDYTFLAEPNNNLIYKSSIKSAYKKEALANITSNSFAGDIYLTANYKHGGFPSYYETVLRPVSEMTFERHPYMMVTLRFVPESADDLKSVDETMVDPWMEN